MIEANLYPEIKRRVKELTDGVSKIPGSTYNQGLPDYVFTYRGIAVHMEVKIDTPKRKGEVSELQKDHLRRHAAAEACCFVLCYVQEDRWWEIRDARTDYEKGVVGNTVDGCPRASLSKLLESYIISWVDKRVSAGASPYWRASSGTR